MNKPLLEIALFYVLHLRSKACRWEFGYLRQPDRVHVFYVDENEQARIVPWKGLIEQPRLCRQVFWNIKRDHSKFKLVDSRYQDETDTCLAKAWYNKEKPLTEDKADRILAMAKVDAAARFVYLQEHQAWCELPLRILCHALASDFEADDPQKIEAANKLMKVYVETGHQKEAAKLGEDMLHILNDWNRVKLKTNLGWVYKESKLPKEAEEHLLQSLDIVDKCHDVCVDDRDLQKARILNNLGPVLADLQRPQEALEKLEECWEFFKEHVGKDGLGEMKGFLEHLENREKQDKLTEDDERSAKDLLTKYPEVAACLNNLGSAYGKLGMYERHSKKLEVCMLLEKCYYGEEHPKVAGVLTNLSLVCQKEFQFGAAKTYLERSLKLHEMHFGEAHEHVVEVLCNLAVVCAKLKKTEEADGHLERCDKILKKLELGEGHAVLSAKIKNNRGILHMWRGELEEATKKFRESSDLLAGKSEKSPELAEIEHNLGEVLLEMVEKEYGTEEERKKWCKEACDLLNASIESFEEFKKQKLPCTSPKIESLKLLAKAHLTLGELQKAKEPLEEVQKILENEYSDSSDKQSDEKVHLVEVLHYRAVIEHKLENLDKAIEYFEDCLKKGEQHEKKIEKEFMIQINSNLAHTCRRLRAKENDDSRKKRLDEKEEQALQYCVRLRKDAKPADEPLESEDLQLLRRLGVVEIDQEKYEEAACHLEDCLKRKLEKYPNGLEIQGQDCEELAQIVDALGFVYYAQSPPNISKEKEMLEHLIRFKADGKKISRILKRLRAACMKMENIQSRIEFAKELLATCKDRELGDVEHAHVLLCLATTFLEKQDLDEVKKCCSDIPNLCLEKLDKDANMELLKSLSETWLWLGEEYVSKEMYEDAERVLEECLDMNRRIFDADAGHVEVAKVHLELGPVYRNLGKKTKAKKMLEDVLNSEPPPCSDELDLATAWGDLGLVYCDLDDFENAKKCFTECWKKKKPEDLEVVVHNLRALHQRFNRAFKQEEWQQSP